MNKLVFFCILALAASGCQSLDSLARSHLDFINYTAGNYPARSSNYPVDLFFEGAPTKAYEVIGEIIGYADEGSQVRPYLEARVRQVGGDGAVEIETKSKTKKQSEIVEVRQSGPKGYQRDVPVAKTNYYDVLSLTAKVIKYKE